MTTFDNSFDAGRTLRRAGCSCGQHADQAQHDQLLCEQLEPAAADGDKRYEGTSLPHYSELCHPPDPAARRALLKSVGAATIAWRRSAEIFPLEAATEPFAEDAGKIEKPDLKIGFIPITCASPIIMAAAAWASTPDTG